MLETLMFWGMVTVYTSLAAAAAGLLAFLISAVVIVFSKRR